MLDSNQFFKGKYKKSFHFYGWILVAIVLIIWGLMIIKRGQIKCDIYFEPVDGWFVYFYGVILVIFGLYFLYYLIFRSDRQIKECTRLHPLKDFEKIIEGYHTFFSIDRTLAPIGGSNNSAAFYYTLVIDFNEKLNINLNIKQRRKLEYFLWKIGITKRFDVLTGNDYFDSKYRVKTTNKPLFRRIIDERVIHLLEEFDRDYPPIYSKNGNLILTDQFVEYIEGPYLDDQELFKEHRGNTEEIFLELIIIIKAIEKNILNYQSKK